MKRPTRRNFLRTSTLLVPTLGLIGRGQGNAQARTEAAADIDTDSVLQALAELVLPVTALRQNRGEDFLSETIAAFDTWSDGFEPLAELDHPYLSSDEIRYGPPDPRPAWLAQLEGLELEAQKRHGVAYGELDQSRRRAILERQLPGNLESRLPHASSANHVAVALLAWFYATSEANDLCHGRKIGRYECRGLPSARELPRALEKRSGEAPFEKAE